jgi:hypothetical protein
MPTATLVGPPPEGPLKARASIKNTDHLATFQQYGSCIYRKSFFHMYANVNYFEQLYALRKLKAQHILCQDEPSIGMKFLPILWAILGFTKRNQFCLSLKEPQHSWGAVEIDVWHTASKMLEKKYLIYYIITNDACNNLVFELTPFLQSHV